MNKYIVEAVENEYGFDPKSSSAEELQRVEEIIASDVTGISDTAEWDFSSFPNLKRIDCSFNGITELNVCNNPLLEDIRWEGVRGRTLYTIDFSNNKSLRKIRGGQDGMVELDLSANSELESVEIWLNHYLRWLNLDNCRSLKRIDLTGVIIPFVDLTHCNNLTYVNINYLNQYARKRDEYGPGYPRPIIFVAPEFDESVIPRDVRYNKNYAYILVRTNADSNEEKVLLELKADKQHILDIYPDNYGEYIAKEHYRILSMLYDSYRM